MEPTVALVFSPEQWVEDLHRHLVHHGGGRVRQVVVEPSVALEEEYDALVVSDRWPALTARFVDAVHHEGRRILGVFDPDEPAGKDHLLTLGVDTTIASDATMADFVDALAELGPLTPRSPRGLEPHAPARALVGHGDLIVVSGPRGGGITEIAVGLAAALGDRRGSTILIDAHEHDPAVAGRLGLAVEPNLRSAIDAHHYGLGDLGGSVVPARGGGFGVVAGFPSPVAAAQVTTSDVLEVIGALRDRYGVVVVDAGDSSSTVRALVAESNAVVGVATASPVGIVRALAWAGDLRDLVRATPLHLVVNRAPGARYRRAEIRAEIVRTLPPTSLTWVPADPAVDRAAWDGDVAGRGPFRRAMDELAAAVGAEAPSRRRTRRARRDREEHQERPERPERRNP